MGLKRKMKRLFEITKKTFTKWNEKDPFRQSAVIAYYSIFSLPPLLVIIIALAGLFLGREAVSGEISTQISGVMGADTAKSVEEMIAKAGVGNKSIIATIIGIVVLLIGATSVFGELQKTLNIIWEVKPKPDLGIKETLKTRLFSFGLIVSIGFLLLVSLVLSSALAYFGNWIDNYFSEGISFLVQTLNFVISTGVITVLFALMFKVLPDAKMEWKDVWIGAFVTALLFTLGKFLLGLYFGKAQPGSTYGAAGSVILIMLWVSYSSLIVLFGAEFTKQYAERYGVPVEPADNAVKEKVRELEHCE